MSIEAQKVEVTISQTPSQTPKMILSHYAGSRVSAMASGTF